MIAMSVMYPSQDGGTFDMDYYLNTHLPLVGKLWGEMGQKGAQVVKGVAGGGTDTEAPYVVMAQVFFETREELHAAQKAHGKEIFADLANFTNLTPVVQVSEVLV